MRRPRGQGLDPVTRRARQSARADRLREWADGREAKAESAFDSADALAERFYMGQPILVGHASEAGARRDQDRITAKMRRGIEDQAKAADMRAKADGIDRAAARAIYSDDDDAAGKLRAKIARLEDERDRIKAFNKSCRERKACGDTALLDAAQRATLLSIAKSCPYQLGRFGQFPGYATTNLGATINAARRRLGKLG